METKLNEKNLALLGAAGITDADMGMATPAVLDDQAASTVKSEVPSLPKLEEAWTEAKKT